MEATLTQFLIVCPLVFLAGFVDAVAGGGGLISLPAYLLSGLPVHYAIATNKMSSGMGTALTTWHFWKNGYINWKRSAGCVICAMIGSNAGAHLALMLSDRVFRILMLVILPLTAVYILRGRALEVHGEPHSPAKTTWISMAVALGIGVYDGFYGPGTGTFLLLLLTGVARMGLNQANGTAKVINVTTNFSALFIFLLNGKVLLPLGLTAGCFSLLGNYAGSRLFEKSGARSVRPLMVGVLCLFFVRILAEL